MKKFILSAAAAGALAFGGAASAQGLGNVLGNIFGYGPPQYSYGNTYPHATPSTPAVVAGTQPYYNNRQPYYGQQPYYGNQQPYNTTYVDQYGRQVRVDQYGRHVVVQPNTGTYGITGYDAWGRPVYGTTYGNHAQNGRVGDRDGDGVANVHDRWPDNRAYW